MDIKPPRTLAPIGSNVNAPKPSAGPDPNSMADVLPDTPAASGIVSPSSPSIGSSETSSAPNKPASAADIGQSSDNSLPIAPAKKRKKMKLMVLVSILVLVILGAGSAAAYVGYYLPNKPENVLGQALMNTFSKDVTSVSYDGELDVEEKGKKMGGATFSGAADNKGALDFTAKVDVTALTITADARSLDGKSFYLRVGGLDGLAAMLGGDQGTTSSYAALIDSVNDQWYEINESLVEQYSGGAVETKLSDADRQKVVDAYKERPFLIVKEALPDDTIKGVDSYHYVLGIDKPKLKLFVAALKVAKLDSIKIDAQMLKDFNKSVDEAKLDNYTFDVWITKDAKQFKQVQVKGAEDGQDFTMRVTVKELNKPVTIEKPEDAKSIAELLGAFMGSGGTEPASSDQLMQQVQGISL